MRAGLLLIFLFSIGFSLTASASQDLSLDSNFEQKTPYQVCFTPQDNCTQLIIQLINSAKTQIRAQIYSFTSKPIAKALVRAEKRGVDVQVIYDQTNGNSRHYSLEPYLVKNHIPAYLDTVPGIAHNKVLIIDSQIIETGSFNYTQSAQENNAENVLIIHSPQLAQQYLTNWQSRKAAAILPNS